MPGTVHIYSHLQHAPFRKLKRPAAMDKPELYSRASDVQRHDAMEIVDEHVYILGLHGAGKQSLMDVGSGSGDVLIQILVPAIAKGFTRITGIDISPKMVEYSTKCYASLKGVNFKELDIETKDLPVEFHEQFDRVTSFYCLHWIKDQKQAVQNIYKCLRKNGDCLLVFLGSNSVNETYNVLSKEPRWKDHVKELSKVFSPLLDSHNIVEDYKSLLQQQGFIHTTVEVKKKTYTYPGTRKFKDNMKAVNPFKLPPSEYEAFFNAMCDSFHAMGLREDIPGSKDYKFVLKYQLIIAYARKGK